MSKLDELKNAVINCKTKLTPGLAQEALDEGAAAGEALSTMIAAMDVVGERFAKGEIFIPEMLMAAKAMAAGVEVLKPSLAGDASASCGMCIIGTVAGDLHDIGKNLAATMIEAAGFSVIDLGVDVPVEAFTKALDEHPECNLVALSALLTTMVPSMRNTVEKLKEYRAATGKKFKIHVGGGCMTQELADEMGADGFGKDAGAGAAVAKRIVAE